MTACASALEPSARSLVAVTESAAVPVLAMTACASALEPSARSLEPAARDLVVVASSAAARALAITALARSLEPLSLFFPISWPLTLKYATLSFEITTTSTFFSLCRGTVNKPERISPVSRSRIVMRSRYDWDSGFIPSVFNVLICLHIFPNQLFPNQLLTSFRNACRVPPVRPATWPAFPSVSPGLVVPSVIWPVFPSAFPGLVTPAPWAAFPSVSPGLVVPPVTWPVFPSAYPGLVPPGDFGTTMMA